MRFNLNDYETVEERIRRFYGEHPDGRIMTEDYSTEADRANGVWRVRATIFLDAEPTTLPKSTGHAFERDGGSGPNQSSALENCETSAIGRALANMNMSGNKRASREEMAKVARAENPDVDWAKRYGSVTTVQEARELYQEALAGGAPADVLKSIETLGLKLGAK